MVRYIIKIGDGTKFYTRKDLYMKDGEEEMENESNDINLDDEAYG